MSKEAIITSSRLNCYGTRVLTEGVDTEQYEKNPILLYMHRRGSRSDMPIGVIENLRREGDFIYGTPKFDELTEEEKIIAAKWENGTLRMLSAGLEIIEWSEDEKYLVQGQTRPTVVRSNLPRCRLSILAAMMMPCRLYDFIRATRFSLLPKTRSASTCLYSN